MFSTGFAADDATTLSNLAPVLSGEVPVDDATGVDIDQATVSVLIEDPEGNSFDWSIEGAYINDASGSDEGNGTKSATVLTPLPYDTLITWFVNASDGMDSVAVVYVFTTRAAYVPSPPAGFSASAVSRTEIDLSWTPDVLADATYVERNSVSSWARGAGTVVYNGSGSGYVDMSLSEGTQYFYQA